MGSDRAGTATRPPASPACAMRRTRPSGRILYGRRGMGARRAVQDGIDTARPGPSRDQPVMASQSAPLPVASHAGRTANPARKPESEVL